MNQLTLIQRRSIAIGLLCLMLVIIYQLIFSPLLTRYLENKAQINQLEHQMEVYQRVIENSGNEQTQLEQMRAENPSAGLYLNESRPSLAAAMLQQLLTELLNSSGGQLVSTQIISNATSEEIIPAVTLQVRMRSEINELVALLYDIESHQPYLFTENLIISSTSRVVNRPPRISSRNRAPVRQRLKIPTLDVRFDLIAYTARGGE
ncbi:type II secretion system protein GspM [uncultured Neptuniibacter sp.]|uniref:type II secretion system protein GspM n=1 Tax=uncultured Neptuniibacter sp. TaxID=502143 RepID=UPI00260CD71B|nr:type II secretion system protein GspM [uncultured Neptuniibacter sp.]